MRDEVFEIIAGRKKNAERAAQAVKERVMSDSDFATAEREYKRMIIEGARNPSKDATKKLAAAAKKRSACLAKLNLTETDLLPRYSCALCNDTGFRGEDDCVCAERLLSELLQKAGRAGVMPTAEFKDFDPQLYPEGAQRDSITNLYSKMQEFCNKFPEPKIYNILLLGQTGVGKTQLAASVARELIRRGFNVLYLSAFGLSNLMLKCHSDFSESRGDALDSLLSCDLLVIDDLGSEPKYRNITEEYLLSILNERAVCRKSTIVTTNLSLNALEDKYGTRIISRMTDKSLWRNLYFIGQDLRLKNTLNNLSQ